MANLDGPSALMQTKTESIAQYLSSHSVSKGLTERTLSCVRPSTVRPPFASSVGVKK